MYIYIPPPPHFFSCLVKGEIIRVSWKDLEQEGREHIEKTAVLLGHDSHVQSDL